MRPVYGMPLTHFRSESIWRMNWWDRFWKIAKNVAMAKSSDAESALFEVERILRKSKSAVSVYFKFLISIWKRNISRSRIHLLTDWCAGYDKIVTLFCRFLNETFNKNTSLMQNNGKFQERMLFLYRIFSISSYFFASEPRQCARKWRVDSYSLRMHMLLFSNLSSQITLLCLSVLIDKLECVKKGIFNGILPWICICVHYLVKFFTMNENLESAIYAYRYVASCHRRLLFQLNF